MKKALLTVTILGSTAISTGAHAEDAWPYWYVGLNAGATYQTDSDFTSNGAAGEFSYDVGTQYGGTIGYMLDQNATGRTRIEVEYSARSQDFDDTGANGDIETNVYTANLYHDFLSSGSRVMPYVGVGAGVADFDVSPANLGDSDGGDTVPVYQLMAGIGYAPENAPRTEISVGYKYLGTFSDPEVDNTGAGTTEFDFDGHSVEVGAKFRF